MYISPSSVVYLLKDVPLDSTYNHTLFFEIESQQHGYFLTKIKTPTDKFTFNNQTYQRCNKNTIRLRILADDIYDCNYMMFQNYAYGNKWFYAFIDKVNYINDGTTEIEYTVDDIQTWLFDIEFGECFIERQHSETDDIGDNIVEENLEIGEPFVYHTQQLEMYKQNVAVVSTGTPKGQSQGVPVIEDSAGVAANGVYSALLIRSGLGLGGKTISFDCYPQLSGQTVVYNITNVSEVDVTKGKSITVQAPAPYTVWTVLYTDTENDYMAQVTFQTVTRNLVAYYKVTGREVFNASSSPEIRPLTVHVNWDKYETEDEYTVLYYNTTEKSEVWFNSAFDALKPNGQSVTKYLNEFIKAGKTDSIVNVYQYPAWIDDNWGVDNLPSFNTVCLCNNSGYQGIKNKKLFTYPFNYLVISNNLGANTELRWENSSLMSSGNPLINLKTVGNKYGAPSVFIYPTSYRGCTDDWESGLSLSNFPTCAWKSNVYTEWWNQNKNSFVVSQITGTLAGATGIIGGIATGNVGNSVSGGENLLSSALGGMARIKDIKAIPDSAHGQVNNDLINNGMKRTGFSLYWVTGKESIIRRLDNFFNMFGYAIKDVKAPVIHARRKWTYVKTKGCIIHAKYSGTALVKGIPADNEKNIEKIMDNGITYWVVDSSPISGYSVDVGNYEQDNSVL